MLNQISRFLKSKHLINVKIQLPLFISLSLVGLSVSQMPLFAMDLASIFSKFFPAPEPMKLASKTGRGQELYFNNNQKEITITSNMLFPSSLYPSAIIKCSKGEDCPQPSIQLGVINNKNFKPNDIVLRDKEGIVGEPYSLPVTQTNIINFPATFVDKLQPGTLYSLTIRDNQYAKVISFPFSVLSQERYEKCWKAVDNSEKILKDIQNIKDDSQREIIKKLVETDHYKKCGLISYSIAILEEPLKGELNTEYRVLVLKVLGDYYLEIGLFSKAKENYEQALGLLKNIPEKLEIEAKIKETLGNILLYADKQLDESRGYFEKAYDSYNCKNNSSSDDCKRVKEQLESLQ